MAVYPSPSTSTAVYLRRNASLPPLANFTIMGWFRLDPSAHYSEFFYLGNSDRDYGDPYITVSNFSGLSLDIYDGTDFHSDTGPTPLTAAPTWWHVVYRKTGDVHEVFLSSDDLTTIDAEAGATLNVAANVTPLFLITEVYDRTAVQWVKAWDAALTLTEIRAERSSAAAVKTSDLHLSTPLPDHTDLNDTSGNGRHWTAVSTLATAGPPDLSGGGSAPDAPTNLVATPSGFEHIVLTWDDNGTDETEQEIQRCAGAACSSWATIAIVGPNIETYTDPATAAAGLLPDQLYRYRIRSTNLVGSSDWSNIADATTAKNLSARFPGTPGTYYEMTGEPDYGSPMELGRGGCVAWVRIDEAGYATILTSLQHYSRAFLESVPPSAIDEFDYLSPMQSYIWFGVREGRLVFEAHDGRIAARGSGHNGFEHGGVTSGGTVGYSTAFARDAAVAAFRSVYAGLAHSDGITVPVPTFETSSFGITNYFATFPFGVDQPHGDLEQSIVVAGPALTPGQWHRVGYRWVSVPNGNVFDSSTIELWMDCAKVAEVAWDVDLIANHGILGMGGSSGSKGFVGGDPNDLHRQGQAVTPFNLYDFKCWARDYDAPSAVVMAGECACVGTRPPMWWKLRDADDVTDYGTGTFEGGISLLFFDARPVGSITDGSLAVSSPCNVLNPPEAPTPGGGGSSPTPGTPEASVVGQTRVKYIRRLRRAPHLANENRRIVYHEFLLDLMAGVGTLTGQGVDPVIYLSWSDDGGHQWSNEYPMTIGVLGDYLKRVKWQRLGQSRDRIFQVTMSDPVDWVLIDAYLELTPGRK